MSFGTLLITDIKRLLGHGRIVALSLLTPVIAIIIFASVLFPAISGMYNQDLICGIVDEDGSELIGQMINIVYNTSSLSEYGRPYPINDVETGIRALEDGKIDLLIRIPEAFLDKARAGEKTALTVYYVPAHAYEGNVVVTSLKSCFAIYWESEDLVNMTGELAETLGLEKSKAAQMVEDGRVDIFWAQVARNEVIGQGEKMTSMLISYEYLIGLLFAVCALFAAVPSLYITTMDFDRVYGKRGMPQNGIVTRYLARLVTSSLLVITSFGIMFPIALMLKTVSGETNIAILIPILLIALCYSALMQLVALLFRKCDHALWAVLYIAALMIFLTVGIRESSLPDLIASIVRFLPLKPAVSLLSNLTFGTQSSRLLPDIVRLLADTVLFLAAGIFVYKRKGEKV